MIDLLDTYEGPEYKMMTSRIFATYLHDGVSKPTGFGDQVERISYLQKKTILTTQ